MTLFEQFMDGKLYVRTDENIQPFLDFCTEQGIMWRSGEDANNSPAGRSYLSAAGRTFRYDPDFIYNGRHSPGLCYSEVSRSRAAPYGGCVVLWDEFADSLDIQHAEDPVDIAALESILART